MKNSHILLLLITSFLVTIQANGQTKIQINMALSLDYFASQSIPRFQSNGYPRQIIICPSLGIEFNLNEKISIGLNLEYYSRKEEFDCIAFSDPNDTFSSIRVFINNPIYGCPFNSKSKINYLDIPLVLEYDIYQTNTFTFFASIGIGPQLILKRTNTIRDKQSNGIYLKTQSDKAFILSWKTSRGILGIEKKISKKLTLSSSIEFKTDEFLFENKTIGLNAALAFNF